MAGRRCHIDFLYTASANECEAINLFCLRNAITTLKNMNVLYAALHINLPARMPSSV